MTQVIQRVSGPGRWVMNRFKWKVTSYKSYKLCCQQKLLHGRFRDKMLCKLSSTVFFLIMVIMQIIYCTTCSVVILVD